MRFLRFPAERFSRFSPRAKSVGLFFVSSIFGRGVTAVCQIVQVPIAIRALGNEALGLWLSLISVSYLVTFADFGLGQGTQNKMAEAFATGRTDLQKDLFANAFAVLTAITAFVFLVGSIVIRFLDFGTVFHIHSPEVRLEAPGAVRMMLLFFALNFPLGLAQRLSYARQKGWMHNLSQAIAGVVNVAAVAIAARVGAGLVGMIVAVSITGFLASLVLLVVQFRQLGWLSSFRARLRLSIVRELLGLGGLFALQQILTVVLFAMPQIVISTSIGAADVTSYNLTQRFFNVFAIVQGAFMLPLWPAYSEAIVRSEYGWIRRTLLKSIKATVLFSVLPMVLATFGAHRLIFLWVGTKAALPSTSLIWMLFAWNAIVFLQQPFGYMLAGISQIRRVTIYSAIGTVVTAVLMVVLVKPLGAIGVVVGLMCGFVPFYFFGSVYQSVLVLRRPAPGPNPVPGDELARQAT